MRAKIVVREFEKTIDDLGDFDFEARPIKDDYIVISGKTYVVERCMHIKNDQTEFEGLFYFFVDVRKTVYKIDVEYEK